MGTGGVYGESDVINNSNSVYGAHTTIAEWISRIRVHECVNVNGRRRTCRKSRTRRRRVHASENALKWIYLMSRRRSAAAAGATMSARLSKTIPTDHTRGLVRSSFGDCPCEIVGKGLTSFTNCEVCCDMGSKPTDRKEIEYFTTKYVRITNNVESVSDELTLIRPGRRSYTYSKHNPTAFLSFRLRTTASWEIRFKRPVVRTRNLRDRTSYRPAVVAAVRSRWCALRLFVCSTSRRPVFICTGDKVDEAMPAGPGRKQMFR